MRAVTMARASAVVFSLRAFMWKGDILYWELVLW